MPAKDWKRCDKVTVRKNASGNDQYEVRDHYTNRKRKIIGSRSFPTFEEAEQYRLKHNARLEKRDGTILRSVDDSIACEERAVKLRLQRIGISGIDALRYAEEHMKPRQGDVPLREMYKQYLVDNPQVKGRYKIDFNRVIDVLEEEFGKQSVNLIEDDQIRICFNKQKWKSSTRGPREQKIKTLWKWAFEKGFTTKRIHETYKKVSIGHTDSKALTPFEVHGLLNCAAINKLWELLFSLVLTYFAGFRRAETTRLSWDNIRWHENVIWLPQSLVKGRKKIRSAEIKPNLRKWLLLVKANKCDLPFKISSLDSQWRELKEFYQQENPQFDYVQSENRHTFCGYALASGMSIDAVAQLMNNEPKTVAAKYKELCSKQDAELFWAVSPRKKYEKSIEVTESKLQFQTTLRDEDVAPALSQYQQLMEQGKFELAERLQRNIFAWRDQFGRGADEVFQWHPSHPHVKRTKDGILFKLSVGKNHIDPEELKR